MYGPEHVARWAPEQASSRSVQRSEFARDRARVIHSAALRRLAATTQVLEPATNDFIRNRLTHSIEVAQIGRETASMLGCDPDLVEAACLAHDLGHPPFGHNGEAVLASIARSVGGFEGNAQTFRILTRLEPKRIHPSGRPAGLNLTRAALESTIKYPWSVGEREGTHKFGFYADDAEVFTWVWRHRAETGGQRPLETQVMDFADDVAYSVHDIEDAVACGLLDARVLASDAEMAQVRNTAVQWYGNAVADEEWERGRASLQSGHVLPEWKDDGLAARAQLKHMTSSLIGRFVGETVQATEQQHPEGGRERPLVVPPLIHAEIAVLKALAAHYVMQSEHRLTVQREEADIVRLLVAAYWEDPVMRLDPPLRHDYVHAPTDAARLRAIIDQVASLSDARAWALVRQWH